MQSFKLFLESPWMDLSTFVATMLDKRYDHGPRLIGADWLEEQGESDLAELIRSAARGDSKNWNLIFDKTIHELNNQGISVSREHGYFGFGANTYRIIGHNLYKYDPQNPNEMYEKVNVQEEPEYILKPIIIILSYQMLVSMQFNTKESSEDLISLVKLLSKHFGTARSIMLSNFRNSNRISRELNHCLLIATQINLLLFNNKFDTVYDRMVLENARRYTRPINIQLQLNRTFSVKVENYLNQFSFLINQINQKIDQLYNNQITGTNV